MTEEQLLEKEDSSDSESCGTSSSCSSSLLLNLIDEQNNEMLFDDHGNAQLLKCIKNKDNNSFTLDNTFLKDFNSTLEGQTAPSSSNEKISREGDIIFENPNPDFEDWDFHPEEKEPPNQFTYITHLENLRICLNTMTKKPIKLPLSTNTKKVVITSVKGEQQCIDDLDLGKTHVEVANELQKEYLKFSHKNFVTRRKNVWFQQYSLVPFHKEKKFKKISKIYYLIDPDKTQATKGQALVLSNMKQPPREQKAKKSNLNMASPRKVSNSNHRSSKKKTNIVIRQTANQLSMSNGMINQNLISSPLMKPPNQIQKLQNLQSNPQTQTQTQTSKNSVVNQQAFSPDPRNSSTLMKPLSLDSKILQRRTSAQKTQSPDQSECQGKKQCNVISDKPPRFPPAPASSILQNPIHQTQQQPLLFSQNQAQHIYARRKLNKKGSKDSIDNYELSKQFPMIKFHNNHNLFHAHSSLNKDANPISNVMFNLMETNQYLQMQQQQSFQISDSKLTDFAQTLNNNKDKNNVYQQYYQKKVNEVQLSNKLQKLEKIGQHSYQTNEKLTSERQSLQQSRLSTKELKDDSTYFMSNKTFYNGNTTIASNDSCLEKRQQVFQNLVSVDNPESQTNQSQQKQQQNQFMTQHSTLSANNNNTNTQIVNSTIQHISNQMKRNEKSQNVNSMSLPLIQSVKNESPIQFKDKLQMVGPIVIGQRDHIKQVSQTQNYTKQKSYELSAGGSSSLQNQYTMNTTRRNNLIQAIIKNNQIGASNTVTTLLKNKPS